MVTIAIQQPTYLPWLGYFEQIARSDVFVFLNNVQFERHSWQNRNRLRTVAGEPYYLTVPIERGPLHTPIKDVAILRRDQVWVRKHLLSMQASLRHAPYYKQILAIVERWITHDVSLLADMNIALITDFIRLLGIKTKLVSTPEGFYSGWPEQKCSTDASKKAPDRGPSCLARFIPEGQRPRALLTGLGVTGAWSERA